MINKECFTARWIEEKSKELNYPDKNIIEKVIHAFSLLDMLAASGCPFHFKGGSSLMLLLKEQRHRLSIDIDIICPPGTEIEEYLQSYKDDRENSAWNRHTQIAFQILLSSGFP